MGLSWVQSRALLGLEAAAVTVEVHLANGLPSFTLVGLADVECWRRLNPDRECRSNFDRGLVASI